MTDSIYNVKFKDQGFKFSIVELLGGYKTKYQAVIINNSKKWTKRVGIPSENYLEALEELEFYYNYGFNFGGVIYKPEREVVYQ